MDSLELSFVTDLAAESSFLADTAEDLLTALERVEGLPALVTDARGQILAKSPDLQHLCAIASAQDEELQAGGGALSCPHQTCPYRESFAAAAIPDVNREMHLVHCAGAAKASFAAALVAPAIRADCERAELIDELARSYQELHLLQILSGALEDDIDHRVSLMRILRCLRELFPVEVAEIWVPDKETGVFQCLLRYDGNSTGRTHATVSFDPGLEELLKGMGTRILRQKHDVRDSISLFLLRMTESIGLPVVAVPLLAKSKLLGVLLLRIPVGTRSIGSALLRFLAAAARQLGIVLQVHVLIEALRSNEGLRKEIEIARQIQSSLLPQTLPEDSSFDVFAGCVTAKRVGGDYYDFFTDEPDELGMLIADVSGHSVASGLIAMSFRSSFRQYREQKLAMDVLFNRVNRFLQAELNLTGHFLSAIYGTYEKATGTFSYVNAGHNPPLVVRSSGEFRTLEESGLLLGILPDWSYQSDEIVLRSGDTLVLYTDGVVEAENQRGEMFGLDRLQNAIKKNNERSAKELYHYVLKDLYLFQDEHFNKDDVTLMIMKVR